MRSIVSPLDGIESPFGPKRGLLAFLQKFSGAAAAYSLRDLNGTNPNVVQVRRSSDNAEDSFTAKQINDGSLVSWVGAGNDGFVSVWYDQSGNGNNAAQTTAASQPKIVDVGVLVLVSGKAGMSFDGSDDVLTCRNNNLIAVKNESKFTTIAVSTGSAYIVYVDTSVEDIQAGVFTNSDHGSRAIYRSPDFNPDIIPYESPRIDLAFIDVDSKTATIRANGVDGSGSSPDSNDLSSVDEFSIGASTDATPSFESSKISEVLVYPDFGFSQRSNIESKINNHYETY